MNLRMLCIANLAMVIGAFSATAEVLSKQHESGPVKVTISLSPAEALIGDTVELTVEVTAEKDVEVLLPEFGEALDRFAIVGFVPRQKIDDEGRTVATQLYKLQTSSSGPQTIPPILVEYVDRRQGMQAAPEGLDAYEVLTDPIAFTIQSVVPEDAAVDLKPPLGALEPRAEAAPARWPWIVGGGLALAIAAPFLWQWFQAAQRRKRRRSAYDVARWRLDQLLRQPRISIQEIEAFYVDLSNIVRRYLEDRFELRAPECTTEEFLTSLKDSPVLSADHQTLLREFLKQADLVKFARAEPSDHDIQSSIEAASQFLDETRENAPFIESETAAENAPSSSPSETLETVHGQP